MKMSITSNDTLAKTSTNMETKIKAPLHRDDSWKKTDSNIQANLDKGAWRRRSYDLDHARHLERMKEHLGRMDNSDSTREGHSYQIIFSYEFFICEKAI